MARKIFFSFHFERDAQRAGVVRNSWVTKSDREEAGFWDAVEWEEVKKKDEEFVKKWIRDQMKGSSVTVVLIGKETNDRKYVDYEIEQTTSEKKGLLGIYIHNIKDFNKQIDEKGKNPFDYWHQKTNDGQKKYYSEIYKTYDWINDDGYNNFADWIEETAKNVGR